MTRNYTKLNFPLTMVSGITYLSLSLSLSLSDLALFRSEKKPAFFFANPTQMKKHLVSLNFLRKERLL